MKGIQVTTSTIAEQIEQLRRRDASIVSAVPIIERLEAERDAAKEKLSAIEAAAKAVADDLAKMRDGSKLTRSGLVSVIAEMKRRDAEKAVADGKDYYTAMMRLDALLEKHGLDVILTLEAQLRVLMGVVATGSEARDE